MIRLNRPTTPPPILAKQGKRRIQTHCRTYLADATAYDSGTKKFSFDNNIYGDTSVKSALMAMQNEKCCYCESRIGEAGDIEHFRPKGKVSQGANESALMPGYYWLAYNWNNLLYSCKECNQRYKKSLFPLVDPAKRVRTHDDAANITQEEPLLIDPTQTDPALFLGFREEFAFAIDGNNTAETTISVCGLNREDLKSARKQRLTELRLLKEILPAVIADVELVRRIKEQIEDSQKASAIFSAAVRASL